MRTPDGTDVLGWAREYAEITGRLTSLRRRQRKEGRCTERSSGRYPSAAGELGEPEVLACRIAGSGIAREDWCEGCVEHVATGYQIKQGKADAKRLLAKIVRAFR